MQVPGSNADWSPQPHREDAKTWSFPVRQDPHRSAGGGGDALRRGLWLPRNTQPQQHVDGRRAHSDTFRPAEADGPCSGRVRQPESCADLRQMVPAVPQCVVFNEELRRQRCVRVQRDGRRAIELFVREGAHRVGGGAAIPAEAARSPPPCRPVACSCACFALMSATAAHVTPTMGFPRVSSVASWISIGYMLATW